MFGIVYWICASLYAACSAKWLKHSIVPEHNYLSKVNSLWIRTIWERSYQLIYKIKKLDPSSELQIHHKTRSCSITDSVDIDRPCCKQEPYFHLAWCETPSKRTRLEEDGWKISHLYQEGEDACHQPEWGPPPYSLGWLEAAMLQDLVSWRIRSSDERFSWIWNILAGKIIVK